MKLTLNLYLKLTFGRLHHSTPEVMELARLIKRTANSVAIRLSNYASCDPYIKNSDRTGMVGGREKCLFSGLELFCPCPHPDFMPIQ